MEITKDTAAYHDIIWFACDVAGRIIMANSREGNIPTFVAMDENRTEQLVRTLCGLHAIDRQRSSPINYDLMAEKGYYCFVNDDPYDGELYRLYAKPKKPCTMDSLDDQTRQLLALQKLDIDSESCEFFLIKG